MKQPRKIAAIFLILLVLASVFTVSASADMGPKPSVNIDFTGFEGEFYVTLLSKHKSTGPYSADSLQYNREQHTDEDDLAAFDAFAAYKDSDGYYFLGHMQKCSAASPYRWGYYPPSEYKILIYYPQSSAFEASEQLSRYAFNSYYTAKHADGVITVAKSYDYVHELLLFLMRVVITIAIELLIALPFGLLRKKTVGIVIGMNVATQIVLNVILNLTNYSQGWMAMLFAYVVAELIVFVAEGFAYMRLLPKKLADGDKKPSALKTWMYALVGNAASFGIGYLLLRIFELS